MSCNVCQTAFGWVSNKKCKCEACNAAVCVNCLVGFIPKTENYNSEDVKQWCQTCKVPPSTPNSVLKSSNTADPLMIWLHGGGGSKEMFEWHANQVFQQGRFQCLLIDLPGHGANCKEPLTMLSAIDYIHKMTLDTPHTGNAFLVGGSLGGYIGMEVLGKYPNDYSGAAILMCGQAVGVDRGIAASFGLIMMSAMKFQPKRMVKLLRSQASKNKHLDPQLVGATSYTPGMYFGQAAEQIAILRQTDPMTALKTFAKSGSKPVLFMNGELDHRDSEERWKQACNGKLIVFPNTDHFFSHDSRYKDIVVSEIISTASQTI
jgi:pimeloyl-ACP methyl ester carboxylesterase